LKHLEMVDTLGLALILHTLTTNCWMLLLSSKQGFLIDQIIFPFIAVLSIFQLFVRRSKFASLKAKMAISSDTSFLTTCFEFNDFGFLLVQR
jgi:hypothetical protein